MKRVGYTPMIGGMAPGVGNRPASNDIDKQRAKVEAEYIETMHHAGIIEEDLLKSPLVGIIYQRLTKKISEFLKQDQGCLEDIEILMQLRQGIEWGPKAAQDKVDRLLGPVLRNFKKE